jgi:hypothetical protein
MLIIQIDWNEYFAQVKDVLPRDILWPAPKGLMIVPPPQFWIIVLLIKHCLHKERVEEVSLFPPRLLLAELLIMPCKANLQEVIYDLVVNSLTAIEPCIAQRFFLASFKANNFLNFVR